MISVKFDFSNIPQNVDAKTKLQKSNLSDPTLNTSSNSFKCSFIILVKKQLENEIIRMQKKKFVLFNIYS